MGVVRLNDIRSVRKALGLSQSKAADLLGLSARAVQSYEQGLRSVPSHVERLAAMLLYLKWRKAHRKGPPCWRINQCGVDARERCPSYQYKAADLCWMIAGTFCQGTRKQSLEAKLEVCQKCGVMSRWLEY